MAAGRKHGGGGNECMKSKDLDLGRLLHRTLGLNPGIVNASNVEEALRERMAEQGIKSRARYVSLLRHSRRERISLVEHVALPAGTFFQSAEPFESLRRWVKHHWLARPSKQPLRVLSVPCATGEEPYSLVITLLEQGLSASQFHVDAADINDRALRRAAAAVYPLASLESAGETIRERYFQREPQGHRLCPSVRAQVSFLKTDLLGRSPLKEHYDIIFGRSLMMYFAPATQQRILVQLERILKPGGLLIVGATSCGTRGRRISQSEGSPGAVSAGGRMTSADKARLKEADALLESRHLREAAALCIRLLEQHQACAQAVCLLGRIAQAEGRLVEAREFFRRALYLQPRFREAQLLLTRCPPWAPSKRRSAA